MSKDNFISAMFGVLLGFIAGYVMHEVLVSRQPPRLPFAAMAWAPLAIYTAAGNPLALLASQVIWGAVLWPLGMWLWQANREKLVSYGG